MRIPKKTLATHHNLKSMQLVKSLFSSKSTALRKSSSSLSSSGSSSSSLPTNSKERQSEEEQAPTESAAASPSRTTSPSAAYKCAMEYMRSQNTCDSIGGGERCCSPNFVVKFIGSQDDGRTDTEMPGDEFHQFEVEVAESFPDFAVVWVSVKEVKPGVIVVKGLTVHGTHTGAPYAFGDYPKIAATGIRVNDPILEATIYVDNASGKLSRYEISSFGKSSGPPNFYSSIGGLLL